MRIIKSNTVAFESFHKSLPSLTKTGTLIGGERSSGYKNYKELNQGRSDKLLNYLLVFEKQIKNSKNFQHVLNEFDSFLKKFLSFKETNICLFDDGKVRLIPVPQNTSARSKYFLNKSAGNGTLEEIFQQGEPKVILDPLVYDIDGSKSFYLLIPVSEEGKNKALLSILVGRTSFTEKSYEIPFIRFGFSLILNKIEYLLQKKELKNIYDELHVYQSKLSNDYKLSAIGELTSGILEDILSPLQVITSTTELLRGDEKSTDGEMLDTINAQVKKVKNIINRLVNFAGISDGKLKIQPCNINNIINNFYLVISTSLQNDNYECVLDLEENLPSVLSHPNYINQILSYLFSLVKSKKSQGGGIIIQTKYQNESVCLRVLSTEYMETLVHEKTNRSPDVNIRIIKNIVAKHEGQLNFETDKTNGTSIQLLLPLKRKINQ